MLCGVKAKLVQEMVKERHKYVTKREPSNKEGDELVRATVATIGFIPEIIHHAKQMKAKKEIAHADDASRDVSAGQPAPAQTCEGASGPVITSTDLAAAFLSRHSAPTWALLQSSLVLTKLFLIPQRRPDTRK